VVDTLSNTPEIWDLRPDLDALLLGSDHSGDLWLLALSTGEIRGHWVPTEDTKLAAVLFPQGLEKEVSRNCRWSPEEGKPGPVPASYLEKIRSSGIGVFLEAELIRGTGGPQLPLGRDGRRGLRDGSGEGQGRREAGRDL